MVLFASAALFFASLASALPNAAPLDPPYSPHSLHLDREERSLLRRRSSGAQLFSTDGNNQFSTTIKFGPQSFKVVIDTGSSDTWLVGAGFQCIDPQGDLVAFDQCGFADVYRYGKDPTLDQTDQEEEENFLVSYGSGEQLTGQLANDEITLAGMRFETEVGVALQVWQPPIPL